LPAVLVDAPVARSFAVVGWTHVLVAVCGGRVRVAEGVHSESLTEPSELRGIRDALIRQADKTRLGSGLSSRALAAAQGLDEMLALGPSRLAVLALEVGELELAVRLQSRQPADRVWRKSLGARSRRLDAGESASIAVASKRRLPFATDDEDALILWHALTGTDALRTRDLLRASAGGGMCAEREARSVYELLQTDDLHNLGGPAW
jgi:hypothetical protein